MIMPNKMAYISKGEDSNEFGLRKFDDIRHYFKDQNDKEAPGTFYVFEVFDFSVKESKNPAASTKEYAHSKPSSKLIKTS